MTTKTVETHFQELAQTLAAFEDDHLLPLEIVQRNSHAYYRSKLFSIHTHKNNLFNAAAPLMNVITTLKTLKNPPVLSQLRQDLCHEIRAFENKLQSYNYPHSELLAARYVLCVFTDEMILNTSWGKKSDWCAQNLVSLFQNDLGDDEKFFVILQRCCTDPKTHIDLLELIYICLCLGYQGKYYYLENGYQELTEIIDQLFEIIQQERGENEALFTKEEPISEINLFKKIPSWSILLTTLFILISIYSGFNFLLSEKADNLYQELNALASNPN